MHTMIPAKSTARPEVVSALMMDDSTSRPRRGPAYGASR